MNIVRDRPWLLGTSALAVLCVLALLTGHKNRVADVLFGIALVLAVVNGVRAELKHRNKLGEPQR